MARLKKPQKLQLRGKCLKPPKSPSQVDKNELRYVHVHDGVYDENLHVVCPNCGVYHARIFHSAVIDTNTMCYYCICTVRGCNTIYKFYRKKSWV